MLAVDMSNYTSPLTPENLQALKDAGVDLVIAQAIDPPAGFPAGVTRQQIQACLDAGLPVDAYLWLWFDLDVSDIQRKLALLDGLQIRQLWLDVEDTAAVKYDQATCEGKVWAALAACDAWADDHHLEQRRTGVYSGRWFWVDGRYMGNTTAFSDRELWDANYDQVADAALGYVPYGGWAAPRIKQYRGTTSLAGISGLDLNVLSVAEAAELTGSDSSTTNEEPKQEQQCDWPWQAKKIDVVAAAGELLSVADQLVAEANRKGGPRVKEIRRLADPEVRGRAQKILV